MQKSILMICLIILSSCRISKNFAEVDDGQFYRSAQLSYDEIHDFHEVFEIKTIINLRGERLDVEWYQDELKATKELGINLINISMSARRLPEKSQTKRWTTHLRLERCNW